MDMIPYQKAEPIEFIERVGRMIAASKMVKGAKTEGAGQVVAMTCWAQGITPIDFVRTYHLIDGVPSMRADAQLAEFRRQGGKHQVLQADENGARVKLIREDGETREVALTWEEAQEEHWPWTYENKKKVLKHNWSTPRGRSNMMWARVVSEGIRRLKPECM